MNNSRVCVVIPTYNNAATLSGVVQGVAEYTPNIIVVNDGSTDDTAQLLAMRCYPPTQPRQGCSSA